MLAPPRSWTWYFVSGFIFLCLTNSLQVGENCSLSKSKPPVFHWLLKIQLSLSSFKKIFSCHVVLIVCVACKKVPPNQVITSPSFINSWHRVTIFYHSVNMVGVRQWDKHLSHWSRFPVTLYSSNDMHFLFNVSPFSDIPFISFCSSANKYHQFCTANINLGCHPHGNNEDRCCAVFSERSAYCTKPVSAIAA